MEGLLTGERHNNNEASETASPELKSRILGSAGLQQRGQFMQHPGGVNNYKLGPPGWRMPSAPFEHQQMHRQMLELGTTSQRPTTLTLRPASESAMRQVENVLMPLRPAGFDRSISDEEVQSTFRTSGGQFSAAASHNEGLESIFSFNYDQPRSTINALLPASSGPNTELGFSGSPQYTRARSSPNYGYNPSSA